MTCLPRPLLLLLTCSFWLPLTGFAQEAEQTPELDDPTQPSARVKAAMAVGSGLSAISIRGLVIGPRQDGTVLLSLPNQLQVIVKPGVPFSAIIDGASRQLVVRRITTDGVELDSPLQNESVLLPAYGAAQGSVQREIAYVEFRDVPLLDALRMISEQSGRNYTSTSAANKTLVNVLLRNLSADAVVEEICKSHNLTYKRDESRRADANTITRVLTVEEFEKELVGFREEETAVFTLLYPNAIDIATAIADLFGDRVRLSLGTDNQDEDTFDLETRFDRFDVLSRRGQQNGMAGNTYNSGGSIGTSLLGNGYSNSGSTSDYRRGTRNSERRRDAFNSPDPAETRNGNSNFDTFKGLTAEQAQRLAAALNRGGAENEATVESLRKRSANIFVTASRRNNHISVRTGDSRAMEEIRRLIRRMDVPTPMVLLEVKVLSVELGNEFRSTFDYQFNNGSVGASFSQSNISLPQKAGELVAGAALPGAGLSSTDMTFAVVSDNFRARIQLLEAKNRVTTLATPLLLTANNEVSRLFLGEERPLIRNISSQTILTENNAATTPNTTIEFRPVGNTLLITPNINSDRTVTLRLLQENSFINANGANIPVVTTNGTTNSTVQNVPVDVVGTRSISGTFVAKDNMAVAVGGLIEETDSDRRAGVPVLGRVPGLGILFRRTEKVKSRRELIIMIRPHVISTPADSEQISQDLLQNLAGPDAQRLLEEGLWPVSQTPPAFLPVAPPRLTPKEVRPPIARQLPSR